MAVLDSLGFGNFALGGYITVFRNVLIVILISIVVLVVVGIIVWRKTNNKKFNIPVLIVTPRSDGRIVEINDALGGYFKSKKYGGITTFKVKRKGMKTAEIPPPSSNFLIAPNRKLILVQKGLDDYEPALPDSLNFVETETGEVFPILKLKAINQDATAWSYDVYETAKNRFTFASVWDKYQTLISLLVVVFILFLILYINWIGMKDVVTGLKELIEVMRGTSNIPVVTSGG